MSIIFRTVEDGIDGSDDIKETPDISTDGFIITLSNNLVLIDNGGIACFVDPDDLWMPPKKEEEETDKEDESKKLQPGSFYKTDFKFEEYRSGPRAVFNENMTEGWVVRPYTHREVGGTGSRGLIEVAYFDKIKEDRANEEKPEEPLPYTTLPTPVKSAYYFAHCGVQSLYLSTPWPYYEDASIGVVGTNVLLASNVVTYNNIEVFGQFPCCVKGVTPRLREFKVPGDPSGVEFTPNYSGVIQTEEIEKVHDAGEDKEQKVTIPCIESAGASSLSAYNFKLMCKDTGQQGTNKIDYFKPLYARGHDRAYTIGHPINFSTNPAVLFNDYLKVGSGSMLNTAEFLKSANGAPYYKQFARVYPVLHFISNRKIIYDPVGFRAATTVSPVGLTGPHAFAVRTFAEFAGPTVQVEYKEVMSDKSCLLDCCMYENTDFAVRMARYGYTYACPNNDLFVVNSYSRGTLVLQIHPKGGPILHIEGKSVNEDSTSSDNVMLYRTNNRTPEEYLYIDAFTFAKHKFKYESQLGLDITLPDSRGINEFIVPTALGSILVGGLSFELTSAASGNLVDSSNVAYSYNSDKKRWALTLFDKVPAGLTQVANALNGLSYKARVVDYTAYKDASFIPLAVDAFVGSLDLGGMYDGIHGMSIPEQLTFVMPDIDKRQYKVSLGSYHDTVIANATETAMWEGFQGQILMGLSSERGIMDMVFDKYMDANIGYVCNLQGETQTRTFTLKYYSVMLLMSNRSDISPERCKNLGLSSNSELYWMNCSFQRRFRYTNMPGTVVYQSEDRNTCTEEMDYPGLRYGLRTEHAFPSFVNTGRLSLLRYYGGPKQSGDWTYVFLETELKVDIVSDFQNITSDLTNASATISPFPFGYATATPGMYHVTGQDGVGTKKDFFVIPVINNMSVSTNYVRQLGIVNVSGPMPMPKVVYKNGHVFSYTQDQVFAFDPRDGVNGIGPKSTKCKFVELGHGTHRYIDRFDHFMSDEEFVEGILKNDPDYNPDNYADMDRY